MVRKKTSSTGDVNNLQEQVDTLTKQLNTERQKTTNFAQNLGKMRMRVIEVLELENSVRTQVVREIDSVFDRSL
jgi:hypothetical protein